MSLTDRIQIPSGINSGVKNAKLQTMLDLFGKPRDSFSNDCQPVTNSQLKTLIVTENVGPFKVTGLKPAVADLREIFAEVHAENPTLYAALGTAGMLCARLVRGTKSGAISNHAWGTAIDIKINDELDTRGDGTVQLGLTQLAPFFHKRSWFWGAGFGTEDGMHFEASDGRVREWHALGLSNEPKDKISEEALRIGDRGPEVRALQNKLNANGFSITVDGDFGPNTQQAITTFQQEHGLNADGVAGPKTFAALGL